MKKRIVVAALCTAALASVALAAPASAHDRDEAHKTHSSTKLSLPKSSTLASGLMTPLSFDVDDSGNVYLAQNFAGELIKISPKGQKTTLVQAKTPGTEIGAVSVRKGTVYYYEGMQPEEKALLMKLGKRGGPKQLADLAAYEKAKNPDQINTYGFIDLPETCAAQFDSAGPAGPATHTGEVDSHPYASVATRDGVYVADAGANDILKVGYNGKISTVAVLPPTEPVVITQEAAAVFGVPDCAVGYKYTFEGVPTDIEVGPNGWLYVTSLPGGPEDGSMGALGAVYKINPWSGKIVKIASGFTGTTGLAVDDRTGVVLVAEMFGGANHTGQISMVVPWSHKPVKSMAVNSPSAIELNHNKIYYTMDTFVPDASGMPQAIGKLIVTKSARSLFQHARW